MLWFLALIGLTIFIFGLIQWANSGATLWQIFKIKWRKRFRRMSAAERHQADEEIHRLEQSTDRYLLASLRIISILAIVTWIFLAATVILNAMGIDWMARVSSSARMYWSGVGLSDLNSSPFDRNKNNPVNMRNEKLQIMGSHLK